MFIAKTKQEIINFISHAKSQAKIPLVAFAPTMGALHRGHLSLIELGKQHAGFVISSIFVNPTQFGPNEDFSKYPRTEEQDIKLLETVNCNGVFLPSADEIYGNDTTSPDIKINKSDILCGKFRPGHFAGVVQVVGKLFDIVKPDIAIFGEKDFQQLFILKENFPNIKIIGAPIIREPDGLAMSSRNKYLTPEQRLIAGKLNVILKNALAEIKNGNANIEKTLEKAQKDLLDSGFSKIDYIEAREEDTLEQTTKATDKTRVFAAAWIDKTRLIDNLK